MDEFTAPMILPFIMLAIVWFDKIRREPVAMLRLKYKSVVLVLKKVYVLPLTIPLVILVR
jgi:hypothetical protein